MWFFFFFSETLLQIWERYYFIDHCSSKINLSCSHYYRTACLSHISFDSRCVTLRKTFLLWLPFCFSHNTAESQFTKLWFTHKKKLNIFSCLQYYCIKYISDKREPLNVFCAHVRQKNVFYFLSCYVI